MATTIDKLPNPGRRTSNYPWSDWMDGSVWKLRYGDDFRCEPSGMAQNLYYKGRSTAGKGVTVRQGRRDPDGRRIVIFQFFDEN